MRRSVRRPKGLDQALEGKSGASVQTEGYRAPQRGHTEDAEAKTKRIALAQAGSGKPSVSRGFSHCMGQIAEKYDGKIVSELVHSRNYPDDRPGLLLPGSLVRRTWRSVPHRAWKCNWPTGIA